MITVPYFLVLIEPVAAAEAVSLATAEEWAARDPLMARGACRARIVRWDLVGINPRAIDSRL